MGTFYNLMVSPAALSAPLSVPPPPQPANNENIMTRLNKMASQVLFLKYKIFPSSIKLLYFLIL